MIDVKEVFSREVQEELGNIKSLCREHLNDREIPKSKIEYYIDCIAQMGGKEVLTDEFYQEFGYQGKAAFLNNYTNKDKGEFHRVIGSLEGVRLAASMTKVRDIESQILTANILNAVRQEISVPLTSISKSIKALIEERDDMNKQKCLKILRESHMELEEYVKNISDVEKKDHSSDKP